MTKAEILRFIFENDLLRMHREIEAMRKQFWLSGNDKLVNSAQHAMNAIHDLCAESQLESK